MQTKQKVTLYLSPELHRKLKIQAVIDSEPMSELAERAIVFYLANPEVVDEVEGSYGRTHQVYACPKCKNSAVLRDGELVPLSGQMGVKDESNLDVNKVQQAEVAQEGEELVPC